MNELKGAFKAPFFIAFNSNFKYFVSMKNYPFILIFLAFIWSLQSFGQVVSTEPVFPTADQPVTIYFDAAKGNSGLLNCNCDVYLHTGVITNQSNSPSDWKYVVTEWGQANSQWKMTRLPNESNKYSYTITPDIQTFYGVPPSETIEQLAFVFRNADGSKAGRATDGSDLYTPVFNGQLTFQLLTPTPASLQPVTPGQTLQVNGEASLFALIEVFDNDTLIYSEYGTQLNYTLTTRPGAHQITIKTSAGGVSQTTFFSYFTPAPSIEAPNPHPELLGYHRLSNDSVFFSLYAPEKSYVHLIGDFNQWLPGEDWQMNFDVERQTYWLIANQIPSEISYSFQYLVDGTLKIADPYSTLVLDPDHDPFIEHPLHNQLPPYPLNQTSGITSVLSAESPPFEWSNPTPPLAPSEQLMVYELLLRDFLQSHSYQDLTDTLSYLKRLGINAIELLPINEFEGNISWGYNPSFHMALDKYYGSAEDFQRFVDACHQEGIAVILDVVFNHAFSQSPLAQLYWDANNNRSASNNPWLNPTPTHPFNVGHDFNHESIATQEFVQKVLTYWLEEFHVDGFRFDLSKGFTQRVSFDDNSFRAYDQKRVAVLKKYGTTIRSIRPDAYLILEHFADTQEENELAAAGFLLWSGFGLHHQYLEAAMGYPSDLQQADYRFAGFSTPAQITYIESHDEERLVYKAKQFGNQNAGYSVKNHATSLDRAALASLFFFPLPGPKMMWQFQELGYDYPINYCPDGSINQNCRTAPKPITWNYLQDPNRIELFQIISAMNHLKKEYEVFQDGNMNILFPKESIKIIHLQKESHRIAIMGNFGTTEGYTKQTFPAAGTWYEFFSGDSLPITSQTIELRLEPGEYRLYSNQPIGNLSESTLTTGRSNRSKSDEKLQLKVYPNPLSGDEIHLSFLMEEKGPVVLMVWDALGRVLQQHNLGILSSGKHHQEIAIPDNGLGWLYVTLQTSHRSQTIPVFSP